MADPRSSIGSNSQVPTQDPRPSSVASAADLTNTMSRSDNGDGVNAVDDETLNGGASQEGPGRPQSKGFASQPPATTGGGASGSDPLATKPVTDVLSSEIGISTLLNRLKQSIASVKEFATFLKKRSQLEEDHCQGLKKLCRSSQESSRRSEHRQGTFASAYDEMMHIHERMAENGINFAASLHAMQEDLTELANSAERSRKTWKQNGLAAEQKVADLEQTMRKSKAKYDSLAEDYDRVRTGDSRQGGKVFGLKGPKSAAQHEEDLLRKVQAADQTYGGHVQNVLSEKAQLESSTRPEVVRTLQDLIRETDAALALQLQKFASFNEKLLLSNGLIVSPLQNPDQASPSSRSMRTAVASINNDKDLGEFISSKLGNVGPKTEIKYERHPVLNPQPSAMSQYQSATMPAGSGAPDQFRSNAPPASFTAGSRTSTGNWGQGQDYLPNQSPPSSAQPASQPASGFPGSTFSPPASHMRSFSQGVMSPQSNGPAAGPPPPSTTQQPQPPQQAPYGRGPSGYPSNGNMPPQGPPQLGALPFGSQQQPPSNGPQTAQPAPADNRRGSMPMMPAPGRNGPSGYGPSAPTKPVFGIPLNALYERDGLAVPMVVQQCMQAVNLFGLGMEGIYRQSGSMNHIQRLKNMFDANSENQELDFRNPENFYHDVNSVTGLLKQFFRDLPDPLLTHEHHDSFIAAAKQDDDIVRRDSLHAIINSLPDPNYATLRAITLHLYRVMDNSHVNRMNSHNLAVIFGPTLMGTDPSTAIADAGWQIKVVDTVLQNTYQIFDED